MKKGRTKHQELNPSPCRNQYAALEGMRALSPHAYGYGCIQGLSFKISVPSVPAEASEEHYRDQHSPRPRTAEHHQLLDPFLLHGEVSAAASCFQEGEEVVTQKAVTWVGSGSHAKYRTNLWHGPTALWDEEHLPRARRSHQASEYAGSKFKVPSLPLHYTISSVSTGAKCQVFPAGCLFLNSPTSASQAPAHW